jgi:PAS domain-containing protein
MRPEWSQALALVGLITLALGLLFAWLGARRLRAGQRMAPAPGQGVAPGGPAADAVDATRWTYEFLEQVLDRIQDGVIVCDEHGRVIEANEAAAQLLRRSPQTLAGEDLHDLAEPSVFDQRDTLLPEGSTRLKTPTEEATAVAFTSCPLVEPDGLRRWVLVLRNLSEAHRTQKRIRYLARYDTLTRVPNRMEFQHRLQQAIARARRTTTRAALLYVDLDGFKDINDRLGHPIGDRALEITSRRLIEAMPSGTLLGRLGGDEFAMVIEGLPADATPGRRLRPPSACCWTSWRRSSMSRDTRSC